MDRTVVRIRAELNVHLCSDTSALTEQRRGVPSEAFKASPAFAGPRPQGDALQKGRGHAGQHGKVCLLGDLALLVLSPREFNDRTGIVIGLPMTTASYNETNPFAIRFVGPKDTVSYILGHQPKSFDWRARGAKVHPWKHVSEDVFALACETLNQIIAIS